jgi:hypothetical protein
MGDMLRAIGGKTSFGWSPSPITRTDEREPR